MARYIDVDAFIKSMQSVIDDEWNKKTQPCSWSYAFEDFCDGIEEYPTTDVAPRAEVAKEIFEDLWEMVIPEKCTDGRAFYLDMAELCELEKKYTKGGEQT